MKNVWVMFAGKSNTSDVLDKKAEMLVDYIWMVCFEKEEDGELLSDKIEELFSKEEEVLYYVKLKSNRREVELPNIGINKYLFFRIELFIFYIHVADRFSHLGLKEDECEFFMDRLFHHANNQLIQTINIINEQLNTPIDLDLWLDYLFSNINKKNEEYGNFEISNLQDLENTIFWKLCLNLLEVSSIHATEQEDSILKLFLLEVLKITNFSIERFQFPQLFKS